MQVLAAASRYGRHPPRLSRNPVPCIDGSTSRHGQSAHDTATVVAVVEAVVVAVVVTLVVMVVLE